MCKLRARCSAHRIGHAGSTRFFVNYLGWAWAPGSCPVVSGSFDVTETLRASRY